MRAIRVLAVFAITLMSLVGASAHAAFAQIPIDPMPPMPIPPIPPMPPQWPTQPAEFPVAVELYQVDATIDGPIASVTVKQVFRNDSQQASEGVYVFPLPADAAPSSFQMTVDGEVVEGQLHTREDARSIYEAIVRSQRDPALLEWLDRGLFQVSAFPIPAGETRTVELTYEQPVAQEDAFYRFTVPLRAYVPGASPAEKIAVNIELVGQDGLRTIYSPSHAVDIARQDDESATIGYEGTGKEGEGDFNLYFGTNDSVIGANLLSYKPAGDDGYFAALVAPSLSAADDAVVLRDLVLVLDFSGSMKGDKVKQAQDAARYIVENLNEGDRFNIIAFSTGLRLWDSDLQDVSDESRDSAIQWIQRQTASGSTNIDGALTEAMAQFDGDHSTDRPAYVIFMTDGLPTQGEIDPGSIVDNALANQPEDRSLRLFTFGVGYDVNTDLLDTLSSEMGGRSSYVQPDEDIGQVVAAFYDQIQKPVLANVTMELRGDTVVDDVFPSPLPDLFAGEQLVITGRYRDGGAADLVLSGDVNGEKVTYIYPDQELARKGGDDFVARLWATRKLGALLDQIRRDGPSEELVDAVVDLSLRYGIISPYTSYLVTEPGSVVQEVPASGGIVSPAPDVSLRDHAYAEGAAAMAGVAAAPASGEAAVAGALARKELQEAQTVAQQEEIRFVGGKSFVQRGWVTGADGSQTPLWVDTLYEDSMQTETVPFLSERYFELADDDATAKWLSVSPELVLVLADGSAVRVTSADEQE